MADQKEPVAGSGTDLALELGVKTIKVTDRTGKVWECPPLDMEDVVDIEKQIGPVTEWLWTGFSVSTMRIILWASMRKVGRSEAQVDARDLPLKVVEVGRMFPASFANEIGPVAMDIMRNSGFQLNRGATANSPKGESPAASNGGSSSESPSQPGTP